MKRTILEAQLKQIVRIIIVFALILAISCNPAPKQASQTIAGPEHPEWSEKATLYEVNIRQYTPEGTFKAFLPHLDRLKKLGTDILWFMPIYPVGEKTGKGLSAVIIPSVITHPLIRNSGHLKILKRLLMKRIAGGCTYCLTGWPTTQPGIMSGPSNIPNGMIMIRLEISYPRMIGRM